MRTLLLPFAGAMEQHGQHAQHSDHMPNHMTWQMQSGPLGMGAGRMGSMGGAPRQHNHSASNLIPPGSTTVSSGSGFNILGQVSLPHSGRTTMM